MSSTSTGTKSRALEMLAQNMPQHLVASRLGVTESAITQLMESSGFQEELEQKRVKLSEKDQGFDNLLEDTEQELLERIKDRAKFGNLQSTIQAFKAVNSAKRRKDSAQPAAGNTGTSVYINMPVALVPQFILNQKNEIVEVDGKTMVSATPNRLNEIMEQRGGLPAALAQDNQKRAQEVLEGAVRSVIQPVKRSTRNLNTTDLVDLL